MLGKGLYRTLRPNLAAMASLANRPFLACCQSEIAKLAESCTIRLEFWVGILVNAEEFSGERRTGNVCPPPAFHFFKGD